LRWLIAPGLLSLCLAFATLATAQSNTSSRDTPTEKIDALFAQWNKPDSPGCALAVIKDGQIIYKHGYDMANLDHGIPISSLSVFNVASVSKQFTAMSIALLAQQGKLSLDDDIRKYLPELPQYPSPVTIRNLIYHTSGMRDYAHLMLASGTKFEDAPDEDVFKILTRQKNLNFRPGEEYLYSNSNYCNYIRIHMPAKVLSETREYQTALDEYWFWDLGNEVISMERAMESVNIGDTVDGDVMIFHPANPDELFILPRHDDMSHRIGVNLYDAINWLCVSRYNPQSGSVGENHERRYFVPWNPLAATHGWLVPKDV
jgi:hypothetical protein